ncbi:hypothetical protein NIES267_57600 [Calothrix parasitica NIES-267]|uniref:Leucine rich repeat variant n=1 Tax=Calothrix parasitica NIES-267 TaxID=1973488 RepID=A0A1Z4LYE7_9CYAN|nr:hypothetical protein NIES267_57600 [Calothrix parasitica NIES-267]
MCEQLREQDAASPHTSSERLEKLAWMNGKLATIVAQNSATPPELLTKLYRNWNSGLSLRRTIALNPNVPMNLVWEFILEFPQEIFSHPISNQLLTSYPDLVKETPDKTLLNLLKSERIPDLLLNAASKQTNKKFVLSMLMNPKTSVAHLVNLFELFSPLYYRGSNSNECQNNWDILFSIDNHVSWEQELKSGWQDEVFNHICAINYVDDISSKEFVRILQPEINDLSQHIVNDSYPNSTYKNICCRLLESFPFALQEKQKNTDFNEHIAHSPTPSSQDIETLAQDYRNDSNLSYRNDIPTNILKKIARRSDDYRILERIALNPNCDVETLEILAEDIDYGVRSNVARNTKTPLHILEKLAEDSYKEARYAILNNPNFTREAFLRLFRKIFGIENYSLGGLLLLLNPNVSPVFLAENADSILWIERYIIAVHPRTSIDTLQILAKDTNRFVRAAALERF